ncbi:MAG: RDD family protein [Burkholderiales bacterium]|nr:RDD family protein [Anaerolineae bacterium]
MADIGTRFIAIFIDNIILGIIAAVLFSGAEETGAGVGVIIGAIYSWYFWTQQDGQTLGKKLMGIRVIKTTGEKMTAGDAIVRYIGYYISGAVFALGYIWALFDNDNQGWHDKLASTYVVKAR